MPTDFTLRQEVHRLTGIIDSQKGEITYLSETVNNLEQRLVEAESDVSEFTQRLQQAEFTRERALAHVEDLKESLRIERSRFDRLLGHSQEVEEGIRARVGLLKRESSESHSSTIQPITSRRKPFSHVQAELERESAAKAEYWAKKVAEVEKKDQERGIEVGDTVGSTSEVTKG